MNLDKERRIKSWFFGFTKIAGAFLIILKIFQFFYSDNNEENPSDVTPELDSLELANPLEGKKEEGLVKTVSSLQKDNTFKTKDKDYGESPKSNTLSIIIYGQNGLDHEIINHLEDTLFSSYELVLTDPLESQEKNVLLQGDFTSISNLGCNYITSGKITYDYKSSSLSSNTVSCSLNLTFSTYDITTKTKILELSKTMRKTGIGFTKEEAKANAIKKI